MINLISSAIAHVFSLLKGLQVKQFLTVAFVGFLLLTTNVNPGHADRAAVNRVNQDIQQNDSDRPKTVGQWNKEARQTEEAPGERLKRIGKESAEAVKDLGSIYPDTAKRSAREVQENTVR